MMKNLFLLAVGLLSSLTMSAQPDGWTDPATSFAKTSTIVDGVEYYLYNVETDAWFAGGNNWWTAAVVYKTGDPNLSAEGMEHGFKFKLTDKQNDGSYHINQFYGPNGKFSDVNNKWFFLTDRNDGVFFTDNSSGDTYWTFTPDNDGNFQIKSSKDAYGANPVGLVAQDGQPYFTTDDGKTSRTGESDQTGGATMTNKDAVCTTWALYCYGSPEAVVEYNAATALYNRMQEIYEQSDGEFHVDIYMSQIGEQKGTLENAKRLEGVLADMNATYYQWQWSHASGDNPVSVTLENPGFETGNMSGWSAIDGTTLYAAQGNKAFEAVQGNYYAEFWHKTGSYSAQQTVENMPAGVYKLSAYASSSNGVATLFINDVETESGKIVDAKKYSLGYNLEEAGSITIGVKSSDQGSAWNCVDEFELLYLGNDGTSWAALFDETYKDKASYCYQQGLQEKIAILRAATTQEAIQRAYQAAREYETTEIAPNVAAWKDYKQLIADATVLVNTPSYASEVAQLSAMLQQAWTLDNAETDPTTKELKEDKTSGYDVIKAEYDRVKSMTPAGTDVTESFIKNYDFTQPIVGLNSGDPTKGWRIDGDAGGARTINTGAKCGECWSGKDFDFYQIIEGAPAGVYQITAQGFTRAGRGNTSWGFYHDQQTGELLPNPVFGDWTPNEAHIYLNDNTGNLSISYAYPHAVAEGFFDSGYYQDPLGEYQYPDDMHSAGLSFAAGEYTVTAIGLIAKDGDQMRIGMKGNNFGLDNWAIFTNFRLTYQAFQADIIAPELEKAVASLSEAHVGTELQKEMADLITRAEAVSKSDGKAMFAILSDIFAFNVKKESSEKVFAELLTEEQNLEAVFAEYKNKCSEEAKKSAQALQVEASEAYENEETGLPTVTTEEAGQIIAKFPAVIAALKTPTDPGSDENPVDFTALIENANMAASKGWTVETGNMATDSSNKIAEFFNQADYNVYQQITNLPEGLYAVQVQGFYRAGEIAEDWPTVAGKIESNAMLYVINDYKSLDDPSVPADTLNCPLRHVSAEAIAENPSFGGEATITPFKDKGDETPWYMPNNLSCASQFFAAEGEGDMNFYTNYIYVYVWGPLDTITLGVKKNGVAIKNDWCAFSNWKLTGYGNNSVKEPGVQTCSYDPVTPVIGEIKGDVNGDGIVNGTDIQAVINYIVAGEYNEKADVNKDELVNGTDIQEIINIIVGNE